MDRREDKVSKSIEHLGHRIERQLEHAVDKATHRPMNIYYNHRLFAQVIAEATRRAAR